MQKEHFQVNGTMRKERMGGHIANLHAWKVNARDTDTQDGLHSHSTRSLQSTERRLGNLVTSVKGEVRAVDYRTETFTLRKSEEAYLRKWLRS